jgi:hypothetical protein
MSTRRYLTSLGLALAAVSCSDANAPTSAQRAPSPAQASLIEKVGGSGPHILKQGPNAPPLETYQMSFWAARGKAVSLRVKYKDIQTGTFQGGNPFLQFDIPRDGLQSGANGKRLANGDSLQITLSIDLTTLKVDFEPSGVQFNSRSPATLQMWFGNADPDLNGDGVVDGTDDTLRQRLSIWYTDSNDPWTPLASQLNLSGASVSTSVYHFSGYSVAW